MRKFILMILLAVVSNSAIAEWKSVNEVDAFTDKKVRYAVYDDANHRIQISREKAGVWMFITRKKLGSFEPNGLIELRVDKNKSREIDPISLNQIFKSIGLIGYQWEPATIGFQLWSGREDENCGYIGELVSGENLSVRYRINTLERDFFSISLAGAKEALIDGLDLKVCGTRLDNKSPDIGAPIPSRAALGVQVTDLPLSVALMLHRENLKAAFVIAVSPASVADKSGIKVGDVIYEFDGKPIERFIDLQKAVSETDAGRKVLVKLLRGETELSIDAQF